MAGFFEGNSFGFLFRQDQGTISRQIWLRGTLVLALVLGIATLLFLPLSSSAVRVVSTAGLLGDHKGANATWVLLYVAYLSLYGILFVLVAVSHYNLSAKRLRALAQSPSWAAALPLAALLTGAIHLLQPQMADSLPVWTRWLADGLMTATALFVFYDLGLRVQGKI